LQKVVDLLCLIWYNREAVNYGLMHKVTLITCNQWRIYVDKFVATTAGDQPKNHIF